MISILNAPNFQISFDEHSKKLFVVDKVQEYLSESDIKSMIELVADAIVKYKPTYYLGDDTQRRYVFSVDIQQWIAYTLANACMQAGVQKFAVVQPEEFIASLSNEQTAENVSEDVPVEVRFFDSLEESKKWLGVDL